MFTAMTLCGVHATEILRSRFDKKRKVLLMSVYAGALLLLGFVSARWIPVVKPIYTVSFTLQAMGWSVFALAFLYVATDILSFRWCFGLPVLFGRHCLFAYMALHVPFKRGFDAVADAVTAGVKFHFGEKVQILVSAVVVCCALIAVLKAWDVLMAHRNSRIEK